MVLIQILLSIIYIYVCKTLVKRNKFLRYLMLFIVCWYSAQLVLAIADPYQHYCIKPLTILSFNLQIIFLILGAGVFVAKHIPNEINYDEEEIFRVNTNNTLLIIQTICLVYAYSNFSKMRTFLLSLDGATNIARTYYFTEFFGSYTEVVINQIVTSYSFVSYFILFALSFFSKKKLSIKDYYLICSGLATVVLTSLTTMGRFEMMELVFVYLFFLLFGRSNVFKDFRIKKRITSVGVIIFTMMIVVIGSVTMFRNNLMGDGGGNISTLLDSVSQLVFEPFVTYFYGPILAFDYGITQKIFEQAVPMCGSATLGGVVDFILLPFIVLYNQLPTVNNVLGSIMSPFFYFPSGRHWNALFTGASNYYLDFGYAGFVFFPFVIGWLMGLISIKSRRRGSVFIYFLFFFIAAYKSAFSSHFQSPIMVFTFLWIFLLRYQKSIS